MLTAILAADAHTAPALEFVLELDVRTGDAFTVGTVGNRSRHVVPITGGTFEGPRVRGEVLDGGADYQLADNERGRTELGPFTACAHTTESTSMYATGAS